MKTPSADPLAIPARAAKRKRLRSCVLKRCQRSALPDKLGKRLRFVPPKTFSRNKTIVHGHFVPLNRFIWNQTSSHLTPTVLKVLARVKLFVSIYTAQSEFLILTGKCLTFETTSPRIANNNKNNKTQPDSSDWVLYMIRQKLFLSALVSLVELVHTSCRVDEFHLAGVERVRCV